MRISILTHTSKIVESYSLLASFEYCKSSTHRRESHQPLTSTNANIACISSSTPSRQSTIQKIATLSLPSPNLLSNQHCTCTLDTNYLICSFNRRSSFIRQGNVLLQDRIVGVHNWRQDSYNLADTEQGSTGERLCGLNPVILGIWEEAIEYESCEVVT